MPTRLTRRTLAALSIASVASITPTSPLVSIRPRASPFMPLLLAPARGLVRWSVATGSGSVVQEFLPGVGERDVEGTAGFWDGGAPPQPLRVACVACRPCPPLVPLPAPRA